MSETPDGMMQCPACGRNFAVPTMDCDHCGHSADGDAWQHDLCDHGSEFCDVTACEVETSLINVEHCVESGGDLSASMLRSDVARLRTAWNKLTRSGMVPEADKFG